MDTNENVQVYEVGYHIIPTIAEENLASEVAAIKTMLEKQGAQFIAEEAPKSMTLAYTIERYFGAIKKKFHTAYFGWVKFEVSPSAMPAIKKALDSNESILRYLLIKTIRENTMYSDKLVAKEAKAKKDKIVEEKTTMTVEEMDKTIDALVTSEKAK
ncbi:MAG: 30S ribosomal protein S6 [Candidatus Paceibacterota bacterium]|jgi:ribosomal protein S6